MSKLKRYRKLIIAVLLISVSVLIIRFISSIDFHVLTTYLYRMPSMFLLVIAISFVGYFFSSLGWKLCMGEEGKNISIGKVFVIRHIGEMLGAFNPTSIIAGDSLKISYLLKSGISTKVGLSSILLMRMITVLSSIFLIVVSIFYLTFSKFGNGKTVILLLLIMLVIMSGFLMAKYLLDDHLYLGRTLERIKSKTNWSFLTRKTIDSCYEINTLASDYFKHHKMNFLLAFLLLTLHWVCGALEFFIVLQTLHVNISVIDAISMEVGVSLFKFLGAIVPGQIGIEEYGNKIMLDVIAVKGNEIWFVVSLVRRSRQLFWLSVAGVFLLISKRKKFMLQ
ncbi:MAG: flippase-like domain-containing protein [Paludibacteraceae bacterium]|nr:flippase-like domain-containing protein [Paludibacteraceae bacterium]